LSRSPETPFESIPIGVQAAARSVNSRASAASGAREPDAAIALQERPFEPLRHSMIEARELRDRLAKACLWCALLVPAIGEGAEDRTRRARPSEDRWYFSTSVYTIHFNRQDRNNDQYLLNLEWQSPKRWLIGAAAFQNSFDQPSQYLYGGKLWRPFEKAPGVHIKLTAGLLHGYVDEAEDIVPFNNEGFGRGIFPSIGYSGRRFGTDVVLYGLNGIMITVGVFLN
jgi:hypothetical protein